MSIKSVYLDKNQLKELRDNLKNIIGSTMLYLRLRDYIYYKSEYSKNFDGEFLINIFDDNELRKLSEFDKNYHLLNNRKNIVGE